MNIRLSESLFRYHQDSHGVSKDVYLGLNYIVKQRLRVLSARGALRRAIA